MNTILKPTIFLIACHLFLLGCTIEDLDDFRVCAGPSDKMLSHFPDKLSDTGLYTDIQTKSVNSNNWNIKPEFELWSDGAMKSRWLFLPEGTQIDANDRDSWRFPVGTKLWKEFQRSGIRVETRLILKTGMDASDWAFLAYIWNENQTEALAAPDGRVDALGTPHNVPSAGECMGCHGGTKSRILGVSAVQLSYEAPENFLDLTKLKENNLITASAESIIIPGDDIDVSALGYLHANCSHCHNQERPSSKKYRCFDPENKFDFYLKQHDFVEQTATYRSAVDGTEIKKGSPGQSELIRRVKSRSTEFSQTGMPPLATEEVDTQNVLLLEEWIRQL